MRYHIFQALTLLMLGATLPANAAKHEFKRIAFPEGKCWLYRVSLTDKQGTPFTSAHPEEFLSQKSIDRRVRQGLAITETDLPISPKYIKTISQMGYKIVSKSKWNNSLLIKLTDTLKIKEIAALPFVKQTHRVFSSPDSIMPATRRPLEKDTTKASTTTTYGKADAQIRTINGIRLHEAGFKGDGMTIAVVDGGFMNKDSIALLNNVKVLGTKNFAFPPTTSIYDELDHGTAVLSTMAANLPGRIVGTAPNAAYWLLRSEYGPTESEAEEDYWVAAVEFADSVGVDLINSSLGYHNFDDNATSHTYRQQDGLQAFNSRAASMLASKGIILVNSAGNDGMNEWKKISCPADARDILTIGAMRKDSVNAMFSSIGPSFDGRVKPDVMAVGNPCAVVKGNGMISTASGTSFSSPVTCGMVACLWQALPQLTALQIMDIVRRSADRYEYPDNVFGYGIPDYWKAYNLGKQLYGSEK